MAEGGTELTPLLTPSTVEYGGIEPKVHSGYGSRRIPLKPSVAAPLAAGAVQQRIFEGQIGRAAADPNNPLGQAVHRSAYGDKEAARLYREELSSGNILGADRIKPTHLGWNKETRKAYPEHWKSVREQLRQKAGKRLTLVSSTPVPPINQGAVLPFSNNIGPGNSIQPARTASDAIAQGHDLHYQDAKEDKHVLSADREAIGQFVQEAVSGSDPVSQLQGLIGAAGLGAKHAIESLTGKVLYGNYVFTLS